MNPAPSPTRTVHCADALDWLQSRPVLDGCSLITSLPDVSELPALSLEEWKRWFVDAARLVLSRTPDDGVALFFQTDIKKDGAWVDKGYLVSRAAELEGFTTLSHKVVCRKPPGTITFGRPAYSHLLAFGKKVKLELSRSSPDVLADAGPSTWTRGMGEQACLLAVKFVQDHTASRCIVDPFCGRGSVLAAANALGLDAIGVELSPKRARQAQRAKFGEPSDSEPAQE